MRTIAEIEAELARLAVIAEPLQTALDVVQEVIADKLKGPDSAEVWLAKQFDGHLLIIFKLSGQNPIPADATCQALSGLLSIAQIIQRIGWPDGNAFIVLAEDMMKHFKKAGELHA